MNQIKSSKQEDQEDENNVDNNSAEEECDKTECTERRDLLVKIPSRHGKKKSQICFPNCTNTPSASWGL